MFPPLLKTTTLLSRPHHFQTSHRRFFVEVRLPWVRDRGLDHAVEKEKHLRPMLALKDLIKSEPSKSIPISLAAEHKTLLSLPTRAADFIRKYPSVFQEFLPPGGSLARPHVRLTPEVIHLDEEEQSVYDNSTQRQDAANRLLKLLMLTKVNKLPLKIVDMFRWDLGLPHDYVRSLLTDYPDYFTIETLEETGLGPEPEFALELVCWSDELAVSGMEKKAAKTVKKEGEGGGYKKGMPLSFPLQFSRGFDLEKKVKKWVDEWQKLPYISPYENATYIDLKSDQGEKWIVAVLHEILNLLVSKKTERENILCLGEYLGLRSGFKRALINHPGIFYTSNKIRTHTVVLREAYKRDLLLEKHPLLGMRYRYIHLMNMLVEQAKSTGSVDNSDEKKKKTSAEGEEKHGDEEGLKESSGSDAEGVRDEDTDDEDEDDEDELEDDDEDDEVDFRQRGRMSRSLRNSNTHIVQKMPSGSSDQASSNVKKPNMVNDRVPVPTSRRRDSQKGRGAMERSSGRTERYTMGTERYERSPRRSERSPGRVERFHGENESSQGRSRRFQGVNERSHGRSEGFEGRTERFQDGNDRTHGRRERFDRNERSQGRNERFQGGNEGPHGRGERFEGGNERSQGRSEGFQGKTERSHGRSERSSGRTEGFQGRNDRSRGKTERSPARKNPSRTSERQPAAESNILLGTMTLQPALENGRRSSGH